MLLEEDLREPYQTWKADWNLPENNRMILAKIQPWVDQALVAAGGNPANRTQRAKANMLAIAYLRQYKPEMSSMKNFLYGQLRGLHRVIGNDQNVIQVPERVVLGRKAIAEAEKELMDELGRYPSVSEIADRTGIPVKTIQKWNAAGVPGYESVINSNTDGGGTYAAGNAVGQDKAADAWQEYVYDSLPDRQRAVMECLYGMRGQTPLSPGETAKKLKISQAAVSQHKKKIDSMLNDDTRYFVFGE